MCLKLRTGGGCWFSLFYLVIMYLFIGIIFHLAECSLDWKRMEHLSRKGKLCFKTVTERWRMGYKIPPN